MDRTANRNETAYTNIETAHINRTNCTKINLKKVSGETCYRDGPSIRDFQYTLRGNRPVCLDKMAEGSGFSRPQTLCSDNIADIVRRVVGAFGNLPSNPSDNSGGATMNVKNNA